MTDNSDGFTDSIAIINKTLQINHWLLIFQPLNGNFKINKFFGESSVV